jgi:conjugative relaxase-like TrwC/TraI family protein
MVATISARGGAKAALAYYSHLSADTYYTRDGEPPGRWAGEGAEQLSLEGPVTRHEFEAALNGRDPKMGLQLAAHGGRSKTHAAGWDITFSAPKSVSVLWALSEEKDRGRIEAAQQKAVLKSTKFLERSAAWARRGEGGRIRERTAGLLTAQFDHHTSRDLDPQLHTHVFVFNLAPRKDGSWGAILSRDLYKSQKQAGLEYRKALSGELENLGFAVERTAENFRMTAIPKSIERAFSKRRQAIEKAARDYGYDSPKGMALASLRTRRTKENTETRALFPVWKEEAKALGFDLKPQKVRAVLAQERQQFAPISLTNSVKIQAKAIEVGTAKPVPAPADILTKWTRLIGQIARLGGPTHHGGASPGPRLRQRDNRGEREIDR